MKEYTIRGNEFKLRYFDFYGNKTPILFIHGLGCAGSFDYIDVAFQDDLSEHRKIVVDLLGAGYSDKPPNFTYSVNSHAEYLNEFIEDIGLGELVIFGHSLGGPIAIELCNLCRDKVKKLILSEPNLAPSTKGSASWELSQLNNKNLDSEILEKIKEYMESGNTMWASSLKNCLPKAIHEMSKNAVSGGIPSWKTTLFSFEFPRCFIFGEKSLPDEDYDDLTFKHENIAIIKNAGHSMAWENPKDLARIIKNFL
ncbi:MAG: alpha/beta hydrolase [Hornefia sp.]|nr:alpha/beta hydrolase [Hornefia sp.]